MAKQIKNKTFEQQWHETQEEAYRKITAALDRAGAQKKADKKPKPRGVAVIGEGTAYTAKGKEKIPGDKGSEKYTKTAPKRPAAVAARAERGFAEIRPVTIRPLTTAERSRISVDPSRLTIATEFPLIVQAANEYMADLQTIGADNVAKSLHTQLVRAMAYRNNQEFDSFFDTINDIQRRFSFFDTRLARGKQQKGKGEGEV
ncbi:hypothetical protein JXD20_00030 [Candidatus Peregrinibacteria bacterium]|nr:hypothetical protein [Candidatus Peregrinibacteria bacterium]